MENIPVFAVIPNYNMCKQLERLLPTLIKRGYRHIYVFDDCSSDASREGVKEFTKFGVSFVANDHNIGAGATRNNIY